MGAYEAGIWFKSLVVQFGPRAGAVAMVAVLVVLALKNSVTWFFQKMVELAAEFVRAQTEEKRALLQQNERYATEIQTFMFNHLEHMKKEREEHRQDMAARDKVNAAFSDSLVRANAALSDILESTRRHREEDAEAHNELGKSVAEVKGSISG